VRSTNDDAAGLVALAPPVFRARRCRAPRVDTRPDLFV
jgi:hypothetical protein